MNINASNPSLINILLQQAAKTQEKKRPTFEEVFAKLNARSARINANKRPMNSLLTNEQLFRYYIKETDPLLRVSNDSFNIEDALNPMKESDPNKIYGRGTTQTSDVIPSRNPYTYAENVGIAPAEVPRIGGTGRPISGRLASLAQQARIPTPSQVGPPSAPDVAASAAMPDASSAVAATSAASAADLQEADNNYREAVAVNNRLSGVNYASVSQEGQMLLKTFFSDDYQDLSVYLLKQLIDTGMIDRGVSGLFDIFYQVRLNKPTNEWFVGRIREIVGSVVRPDEFNMGFNPNNVSEQQFLANIKKRVQSSSFFQPAEMARMNGEINALDNASLANVVGIYLVNTENTYYSIYGNSAVRNALAGDPSDPFEAFNQAAADDRNAAAVFEGLMGELFNDMATEMITNTDINSTVLDPELVAKIAERNRAKREALEAGAAGGGGVSEGLIAASASSTIAEAGSPAGIDIDNVITRRGRGVQAGDVRGPYEKTRKKTAASTLQAAARRTLEQGMSRV
jgi:hypothetical protein